MEKNKLAIRISLNLQNTRFYAEIRNSDKEIIKEFYEDVVLNLEYHESSIQKRCINWIKETFK